MSADGPVAGSGDFGPGGYVPPRAAARARKIVLREQMGLHWPIGAAVAGALILAVIIPIVLVGAREPQPPFVRVGPLDTIDPAGDAVVEVAGRRVLIVRGGGVLAAFAEPPEGAAYCPASRRIEAPDGGVWSLGGRPLGADPIGLVLVDAVAFDGDVWIDPSTVADPVRGVAGDIARGC